MDKRCFTKYELEASPICLVQWKNKPQEHICGYKSAMRLVSNDEAILCKDFSSTLTKKALTWFTSLKANSIDSSTHWK